MKTLALLFALAAPAFADVAVPPGEAQTVPTMEVQQVIAKGATMLGKLVKLKFLNRAAILVADGPAPVNGMVCGASANLDVAIPAEGLPWFLAVRLQPYKTPVFAYARLSMAKGKIQADLLGREIKTDLKGSVIVW